MEKCNNISRIAVVHSFIFQDVEELLEKYELEVFVLS